MAHPEDGDRDQVRAEADCTGAYRMRTTAEHFGVSRMTLSRAVRSREQEQAAAVANTTAAG